MKTKFGSLFIVNLQQGFILDQHDHLIAAYSHHHKTVVMKVPNHVNDFDWNGSPFEDYKFINSATDSFGIEAYSHDGDKPLTDLIIACS